MPKDALSKHKKEKRIYTVNDPLLSRNELAGHRNNKKWSLPYSLKQESETLRNQKPGCKR